MNANSFEDLENIEIKTALGAYMKSRLAVAMEEVRAHFSDYRFNDAATTLYRFLWGEFCDWGIELSKADKPAILELGSIYKEAMKLIHPFMPFISEFLYQELSDTTLESTESIMVKRYPHALQRDEQIEKTFELVIEAIVGIRRAKANIDLGNKKIEHAYIKVPNAENLKDAIKYISLLAKVEKIDFTETKIANSATDVGDNVEVFIPLEGVDLSPIIERLNNQKVKLEKEIMKLSGMLSNERFVANAPKEVIAENQKGLDDAKSKMAKIEAELNSLGV
jgi:valyl-tRNA synthetase